MVKTLIKHGSEAGYRHELATGTVCDRCRNAHRVFDRQYSAKGKRSGLKYDRNDVLDHLYKPGAPRGKASNLRNKPESNQDRLGTDWSMTVENLPGTQDTLGQDSAEVRSEQPSESRLGALLSDRVKALRTPEGQEYVEDTEIPEYLQDAARETPKDTDPAGDWSKVDEEAVIITASDMRLIEENMGTYLSVLGMTLELIDPYCGPIFGDTLENMVKRWSKVVARYPKGAALFMSKGGGIIMDWIAAIQATWPFLYALYEHHLAGTIKTDGRTVMRVVPNSPNGSTTYVDPTMPPVDESYYTTR